ncbi:MAG TPA: CBS domain-containing protein [Bacillota bacterium]|nr:CBS domain-containing protein [Bacillota bacterium]
MKAGDVMSSPVITIGPEATLAEAARLLDQHKISGVPVVDASGQMVGMISEHDLILASQRVQLTRLRDPFAWVSPHATLDDVVSFRRGLAQIGQTPVKEVMTRKLITVDEDECLEAVAQLMGRRKINRLPVLRRGRLVGIISRGDLIAAIAALTERKPHALD